MSIGSFLENSAFDPDTIAILAAAFETAWDTVRKSGSPLAADDQAASTRERLAKRIVAMAQQGERDRQRLVDDALAHVAAAGPIRHSDD
jgi:hypothetical protein